MNYKEAFDGRMALISEFMHDAASATNGQIGNRRLSSVAAEWTRMASCDLLKADISVCWDWVGTLLTDFPDAEEWALRAASKLTNYDTRILRELEEEERRASVPSRPRIVITTEDGVVTSVLGHNLPDDVDVVICEYGDGLDPTLCDERFPVQLVPQPAPYAPEYAYVHVRPVTPANLTDPPTNYLVRY